MVANRRSFGNLSSAKFDSADNLLNSNDRQMNLTKPKQLLTSSIDNNLSDLNNTMTKISLNTNAKSENYLSNQQKDDGQSTTNTISKSVEQLNNNSTYETLLGTKVNLNNNNKNADSNNSSTNSSPQWIQPNVKAIRSSSKNEQQTINKQTSQQNPYLNGDLSNDLNELRIEISTNANNNTTHVIKEVINTPIKREDKKVNLIKMFTGKRNKVDKHKKTFSFDNQTFVDISPKN